jgi:hypothetical protein
MAESSNLPMARLAGVIETPGEHAACSLVFELETEGGGTVRMTYGQIMEALRFAQDEAIMPARTKGLLDMARSIAEKREF